MALRIGELVGVLRADASAWERGLDRAQVRMAGLQRDTEGRLRDMRGRFAAGGRDSGTGFARSLVRTIGRTVRQGIGAAVEAGMSGLRSASSAISSNPYVAAVGAAIAATVAAVALPAIGALISAGVISVAGLGVIGISAMLLKEEPEVKKAAKSLKDTVVDTFREAAGPMTKPLKRAFGAVEDTIRDLKPQFEEMFQITADSGALKSLTDGLDKFLTKMMPGFNDMLRDMKPVFEGLEYLMGKVGSGLSGFFEEIGKSAPEAGTFLKDLGEVLEETLIWAGKLVGWLGRMYAKVRPFIETIRDGTKLVVDAFQWLYDKLVGHSIIPDLINGIIDWFGKLPEKILGKLGDFVVKVKDKFVKMKDKALAKVRDFVDKTVNKIGGLPGRAWDALSDWAGKMRDRAADAGRRLVSAIRDKVGDAVDTVRGLPGRAVRALGGVASRLYNSGRSLIGGFIRGIWSRIGDVANAAFSVVQKARNFFPYSPAKEGPFSGKGWTLYSGRSLIDGFRQGIAQQLPGLRRDLGGLPGVGMAGIGAVGVGTGSRRVGPAARPMVLHVHMGGREFGRLWVDTARREIKILGGDVQAAIGQRGARR